MLWLAVRIVDAANRERDDRRRRQGRRPPGLQRLAGDGDDRAVVRPPRRRRPGGGQAARLAGASTRSSTCSATSTASYLTHAARPRRPAVLPEPHQGPGPGRLLHRLGRPRRGGAAVRRGHPPLRRRALRPARRAAGSSRCSATPSSTRATSGRRSPTRRPRASATCCGSSTSTASPWTGSCPACGSTSGRSQFAAAGWHVVEVKYGAQAARGVRAARRRGAAPLDRRHAQRAATSRCSGSGRPT